ncbi:OmpA/MotB domain-containing protein [Calothrix sp. NIES-4071]|nr:OmpA/MotB domain-containing protein [Calothrix sp. NIES-4071]BAZ58310.1 OmpA/MotB domain-containing protein [Calothrix sp. NIES-4105]
MSEHSTNGASKSPNLDDENHQKTAAELKELEELRSILLGIETKKLNHIYERIDNIEVKPEIISQILPQAIILRTMQDKQLTEAIVPTIEQAIDSSIKKDLNILSDTIFPIIAPATRRAISFALNEMTQSLNQTLEHSLSPQSFKWRLEARQTGKSFAEVVMLRTLIYRVEQVFLIHKRTGLLLQHIVAPQTAAQDPDLVSAMLTAIQDFVKDSFNVQKDEMLQTLQFGELTIWIEEGPLSVVAGIIRGSAPQELRLVFQDAVEKIHLRFNRQLQTFEGETDPFAQAVPYLKNCLEARYQVPAQKNYSYAYALAGLVSLACAALGFLTISEQQRWNRAIENLASQPGIVIIKAEQRGRYINGMRDPNAVDPNRILQQHGIKANVNSKWTPFLSLEPEFVVKRASYLLKPPQSVSFSFNDGILTATGSAPRQWIAHTRETWAFIPGVVQYRENNLVDLNISQLNAYREQLEQRVILFENDSNELVPQQTVELQTLATEVKRLLEAAQSLGKGVKIEIIGNSSPTGGKEQNLQLSQQRASKVRAYLVSQGINQAYLRGVGIGSTLASTINQKDIASARRVSLKVSIDNLK